SPSSSATTSRRGPSAARGSPRDAWQGPGHDRRRAATPGRAGGSRTRYAATGWAGAGGRPSRAPQGKGPPRLRSGRRRRSRPPTRSACDRSPAACGAAVRALSGGEAMQALAVALGLTALLTTPALAQVRYKDDAGEWHMVNSIDEVPQKYRAGASGSAVKPPPPESAQAINWEQRARVLEAQRVQRERAQQASDERAAFLSD